MNRRYIYARVCIYICISCMLVKGAPTCTPEDSAGRLDRNFTVFNELRWPFHTHCRVRNERYCTNNLDEQPHPSFANRCVRIWRKCLLRSFSGQTTYSVHRRACVCLGIFQAAFFRTLCEQALLRDTWGLRTIFSNSHPWLTDRFKAGLKIEAEPKPPCAASTS